MIVLYILLAVVILLFMILAHEFGHYIFGKILKFKINEFSVGFGPAIFSHTSKKTGESCSRRAIARGGYCAFDGEEDDKDVSSKETAFVNQKPWKRIIVLLGGVTMNFITAIIFSWVLLCTIGYDVPQIKSWNAAYSNPYQVGDVITQIDGKTIDFAFGENYVSLVNEQRAIAKKQYENYKEENGDYPTSDADFYHFEMTVKRDGKIEKLTIVVYPKVENAGEENETLNCLTGLESGEGEEKHTVAYVYNAWEGFCRSFEMAFGFAWVVLKSLWMLITFQVPISQVTGTIGTITTIATMASQSLSYLLIFIPLIAANLAVFNILPIPALDGAHIVFVLIEWIRGKPINRDIESKIHFAGLIVLFAFVLIVDILHFVL